MAGNNDFAATLGLLGNDPNALQALQGLVGQLGPSEEDKKSAKQQAIIMAGLGMLGARKGFLPQDLSRAAMYGVNDYNQNLKEIGQQRGQAIGQAATLLPMLQKSDLQKQLGGIFQPSTQPSPSVSMGPPSAAGEMQQQPPMPSPTQNAMSPADQYRKAAQVYAMNNNPVAAKTMIEAADKLDSEYSTTPQTLNVGGKVSSVLFNKRGDSKVLEGMAPAEKLHFADTGSSVQGLNPYTGAPESAPMAKTQSPDSKASQSLGWAHLAETKRHNSLTEGDPALIEQQAQSIAAGKLAPLTGYASKSPIGMAVMGRVEQINPEYSAMDWQAQQKTLKEFTSGKPAQQVRSFNVALAHLDTLETAAHALKNGDAQAFNKVSNYFAQQTGSPIPTNFNAVKTIVGNELVKAIVGSGGGVEDRDKAAKAIDTANSPAQLQGVIGQYKELMKGQLGGLRQQYETGTKRKDFDQFLSPEAKKIVGGSAAGSKSIRDAADAILRGG